MIDQPCGQRARSWRAIIVSLLVWNAAATGAIAQSGSTGAWPIAVLEPPGADIARPIMADVTLMDDVAVVAYAGTPTQGYRVHVAARTASGWAGSMPLVEGTLADGQVVTVEADTPRVAVGLAEASGGGRVDLYRLDAGIWAHEHSIAPPTGMTEFGRAISLRGELMAVTGTTSAGIGRVEAYRRDPLSGLWIPAGLSLAASTSDAFAYTDGERVAVCTAQACRTYIQSAPFEWSVEASVVSESGPVALIGSTLLVHGADQRVRFHRREGVSWVQTQMAEYVEQFDIDGDRLVVRRSLDGRVAMLAKDGSGVWDEVSAVMIPFQQLAFGPMAWRGSFALVGHQGFQLAGGTWIPNGVVGLPDLNDARFGSAIAITNKRLWVGSPGWSAPDHASGGVWVYPRPGSTLPAAGPLSPASPALSRGHGAAISADYFYTVAVASRTQTTVEPHEVRVTPYGAAAPAPAPASDLIAPVLSGRILDIDVAVDTNTLALTWRRLQVAGGAIGEVKVFSNRGQGMNLTQSITLPYKGDYPDFGYGTRVNLYDHQLVAGVMRYQRSSVYSDFAPTERLWTPLAWSPRATGAAGNDLYVVVPYSAEFDIVAYVYARRVSSNGEYYREAVYGNGMITWQGCEVAAIDLTDKIVCLAKGSDGAPYVYRATRATQSSPWRVNAGGRVPGPYPYSSRFSLAMDGDEVYVGWPKTGTGVAGTDVGRVVVMTFNETIFRSGFQ
ncbi:hypothetical protein ACQQ2N_17410 [Dokdonella sp. MW10]|uniref:hypothetical protein n=1 Tax=Dokdonella sp. MW10 TaxID=2992926 RepID=UPI003F817711